MSWGWCLLIAYVGLYVGGKLGDIWYKRKLHDIRQQAYSELADRRRLHDEMISLGVDAALMADRAGANYMLRMACLERVMVRRLERLIADVEAKLELEGCECVRRP